MSRIIGLIFLISLTLSILSCVKRNDFPSTIDIDPSLQVEPLQTTTTQAPFSVEFKDVQYDISPIYEYEIYGVVVSYRQHDGDQMLHKSWNDHLNVADICVVWGSNASELPLNAFKFWNGQFTCNLETRDQTAWEQFDGNKLSNNHLLSADKYIRDVISDVKIGDKVRVRGSLSSYGTDGRRIRGSSTVRTDTGNGACETIYVEDFSIISRMSNPWRTTLWISLIISLLSLVAYIYAPSRV
jgi:hypothetical protein